MATPPRASASTQVVPLRGDDPRPAPRPDRVAVEAPLELRLGRGVSTVLMRTPGEAVDDEELARGFLHSEGMIARLDDIVRMAAPAGLAGDEIGNVLAVELAPSAPAQPLERLFYSSSSCGVCGRNSIASLAVRGSPATSPLTVRRRTLMSLPARLREAQPLFQQTGGVHASGLFLPDGSLVALREDVGRHNALDKLIGWALGADRLPLDGHFLVVSGRVSYEIMQKSIAAGLPLVAAVGAASSLAVDLAEQFGMTLVGFLRDESMTVYANGQRVVDS